LPPACPESRRHGGWGRGDWGCAGVAGAGGAETGGAEVESWGLAA